MKIGSYETLAELGRGGMGVVYRARAEDGREVALKMLLSPGTERLARFERERRILSEFGARDGFVPLLDQGVVRGGPFIVMPLVSGGTLRDRLARGPLAPAEAIELGKALARALARAHERGIVHRDLKPENILFSLAEAGDGKPGAPLIADLGLAKHFDRAAPGASQSVSLSAHGDILGTAGYMAPEQMADAARAGPEADVFALGAILYECLAGQPAFTGATTIDLITKVTEGRFEPLEAVAPDVPRGLAAVVERALAGRPEERFADGFALLRALEGDRDGAPSRRRLFLAASALVLLGAVAIPVAFAARRSRDRVEANALAREAIAAVTAGDLARAAAAAARALELDPGSALAITAHGGVLWEQGDHAGALAEHERAIAIDPGCALALVHRANGHFQMGQVEAALADANRAVELDPGEPSAYAARAAIRRKLRDLKGALADIDRSIEIDPSPAVYWINRSRVRYDLKDFAASESDSTRALEREPRSAGAFADRGAARYLLGNLPGAVDDATRSIEIDNASGAPVWVNRAMARVDLGQVALGITDLDRAIELAPNDAHAWVERGFAKNLLADFAGAAKDLTRAIELDPTSDSAYANRASARGGLNDFDGQIADATRAIELNGGAAPPYMIRGRGYLNKGENERALADLERSIAIDPKPSRAYLYRGIARQRLGDRAGARQDFETGLGRSPTPNLRKALDDALAALDAPQRGK